MTIEPMSDKEKAEFEFNANLRQIAHDAMLELRDTIKPTFNAKEQGYESAEHARLIIVQMTDKRMNKLAAEHLRKWG